MALYEMVLGEDRGYMVSHGLGAVLLGLMGLRHVFQPGQSLVADLLGSVTGGFTNIVAIVAGILVLSMALDLAVDGLAMDE